MEFILYLIIGLLVGGVIGYFIIKITLQKNYILKTDFDNLQVIVTELKIDNAKRISKEELSQNYISKELYENVNTSFATAKNDLINEQKETGKHQATILRLTGDVEQKLSKSEVESNYVAKESFDIINR